MEENITTDVVEKPIVEPIADKLGGKLGKQQAIYELIKNKGSIEPLNEPLSKPLNTERIALLLDIPYSTAKRIVKDLEKKGLIVRIGSKKKGHWEIIG